jgi:hypothetical protein
VPPVKTAEQLERIVASGLGGTVYRSTALKLIEQLDADESIQEPVRRWWNDAYLRMLAENAAADWLCFESDTSHAPVMRSHDVELPLSAALLEWARHSSPGTIAVAWDASERQRRRLHQKPNWWRMRDLAFALTEVSSAPSRLGVLAGSAVKTIVAIVVVALALPGIEIGSVDSPWTWVAFAGVIATTVPFDSLKALVRLMKPEPRVRLVLHRGGTS